MSQVDTLDTERLAAYLEANVAGFKGPITADKFEFTALLVKLPEDLIEKILLWATILKISKKNQKYTELTLCL